jgi:hypothetical protein
MQNLKVPDSLCALSFGPLLIRWHKKKRALSASADNCLNVNTCQRMSDLILQNGTAFVSEGRKDLQSHVKGDTIPAVELLYPRMESPLLS